MNCSPVFVETDAFSYNIDIIYKPCRMNDLNATHLHCLGIDHERFSCRFQGLDQRITEIEPQHVLQEILA